MLLSKLELVLEKPFWLNEVAINMMYAEDEIEIGLLAKVNPDVFTDKKANKLYWKELITINETVLLAGRYKRISN